jgi:hypothetical protein
MTDKPPPSVPWDDLNQLAKSIIVTLHRKTRRLN